MKRVITYGTFDLLHYGHINLLKRAKALGDYLIVALSTDDFNWSEKRKEFEEKVNSIKEEFEKILEDIKPKYEELSKRASEEKDKLSESEKKEIVEAINMTKEKEAMDFIEINAKEAFNLLGEITGETASGEIIDEIFSRFCLGK